MKPTESTFLPGKSYRRDFYSATLALCLSLALPAWGAYPFTVNDNGTVTDGITKLVWDQCPYGRTGSDCGSGTALLGVWPGALAAAVTANAAGHKGFTDWRVPNLFELESITKIDSYTSGQAAIDVEAFPNTPIIGDFFDSGHTWSSTTYVRTPSKAWVVSFRDGSAGVAFKTAEVNFTFTGYVRLVRGGQTSASFDLVPPDTADLSITATDGVGTAVPGGSVTYSITASNTGPNAVSGASVADSFPASCSAVSWTCVGAGSGSCTASGSGNINDTTVNLPVNASVTYTATCTVSAAATGLLANTATVSSATIDPTPGNNTATDTDTLTPQADLSINKTDGVTSVLPGAGVTYNIVASNAGPSNAPGTTIADTLPANLTGATWACTGAGGGVCTSSGGGNINDTVNLPAGASVTYTVSAVLSGAAIGSLSNTATVTTGAGITDPTPGNNSATDTDSITLLGQTITGFNPASPVVFGAAPATLSATGGASGSPIIFATTSANTICTVIGTTVTFTGVGTCNLTANQAAEGNYAAAPQATASVTIDSSKSVSGTSPAGGTITASFSGGNGNCSYASTAFTVPSAPTGVNLTHGAFGFTTTDCGERPSVTVTITYPQTLPTGTQIYKYGPTTADASDHWHVLNNSSVSISGNQITFTITDNNKDSGDTNPLPGYITDPVAVGVPAIASGGTSIPTLSEWGVIMLSGLLAMAGLGQLRRCGMAVRY